MLRLTQVSLLFLVMVCIVPAASADSIGIGLLSYDSISASQDQFDITNLTGTDAFPPDFPITSLLTLSVTDLLVDFTSGPSLDLPGADFTSVDAGGDLDCTAAACNLFGDSITSATLTGTLSPTGGLSGLPSPDTGLLANFSTTITPSCVDGTLEAGCDAMEIDATGTSGGTSATPEPGALSLVGVGLLLLGTKSRRFRRARRGCAPTKQ
jgi:hypothetical protein